jgi:hypothetical protein
MRLGTRRVTHSQRHATCRHINAEVSMRHLLFLASILLLGVTWAVAQNAPATSQKGYSQSSTSTGSQTSVEGCLSSSAGKYMLTDKNGKMYELTGDTSKLAEHVGHEIKVTGTESAATGASTGTMAKESTEASLDVTSFRHISKTCKSAGGMSK